MDRASSWDMGASRAVRFLSLSVFILTLAVSGVARAVLIDRGPNMVYDTVLDITWVRDASLCATLNNCVNEDNSLITAGGMSWTDANTWAANLVYAGFDDWRLPYASVAAGAGPTVTVYSCTGAGGVDEVACRDNELGYMFYYNLDGVFGNNKTGNQTAVGGEMLTNIQPFHWSGTEFNSSTAWSFDFDDGSQNNDAKNNPLAAWAVRSGDVAAAVPEPATGLLFGVGLLALACASRARRRGVSAPRTAQA